MSELVTGEAVVLDLRLAKVASRSLAFFLDAAVQTLLLVAGVAVGFKFVFTVDNALRSALTLVFFLLIALGYPVIFETLTRGRTLGKMALGLRVVRDDGGPIRFRHALVRGLIGVFELRMPPFWFIALISSLASRQGQRVGDLMAGTVVVRERVPNQGAAIAAMPPALATWAAGLDLSRVPDDLALAARQYLARASALSPQVQTQMGLRLAQEVAAVTSPPPPAGVPPWAFLAAVVAERRRRELLRFQPAAHPGYGQSGPAPAAPGDRHNPWTAPPPDGGMSPPRGYKDGAAPPQASSPPPPAARPQPESPSEGATRPPEESPFATPG